jgi:hypothetical protein
MRQRIDLAGTYRIALAGLPASLDGQPPQPLPQVCAVMLKELLGEE